MMAQRTTMSAIPKKKLTEAEYLSIERAAEFKSEFYDGEMFAMAGASFAHNRVKDNLHGELYGALKSGAFVALTSDMRVKSRKARSYTYPDIVVVCDKPEFEDGELDVLLNPVVVIEVLSPSTEDFDRGGKRRRYQQIESLQEYVLVAQDRADIEHYARQANGKWEQTIITGLDADLALASIPARIPLAAIYAGVAFPEPPLD
jgi:Uma2 family endonuclease